MHTSDKDYHELNDVKSKCRQYKMYYVIAHKRDGSHFYGIIDDVDDEGVTMLIPEEVTDDYDRQFGGFGGYGPRRFRRFRRQRFPFNFFLFPFFSPFPFYSPYY
jgi:hypothetical protein